MRTEDSDKPKLTHRTQLFLTEEQYRWLKVKAGSEGSIAAVVRDWIDSEMHVSPEDLRNDPAIRYLLEGPHEYEGDEPAYERMNEIDQLLYG